MKNRDHVVSASICWLRSNQGFPFGYHCLSTLLSLHRTPYNSGWRRLCESSGEGLDGADRWTPPIRKHGQLLHVTNPLNWPHREVRRRSRDESSPLPTCFPPSQVREGPVWRQSHANSPLGGNGMARQTGNTPAGNSSWPCGSSNSSRAETTRRDEKQRAMPHRRPWVQRKYEWCRSRRSAKDRTCNVQDVQDMVALPVLFLVDVAVANAFVVFTERKRADENHGVKWSSDRRSPCSLSVGCVKAGSGSCWQPWTPLDQNTCLQQHRGDDAEIAPRTENVVK